MKSALFVFNGDPMCFIHVLLNAKDMEQKGHEVEIVIEGAATKLIPELEKEDSLLHALWTEVKGKGLVAGVCRACSMKMGTIEAASDAGLAILDDMAGHPSMQAYMDKGYQIITF